ncbi:ABC transporter C-terminal domain-containing protein, partial [Salmonella enterica subsp. enterica serovar Typhimurium]|uniref:ABC transporter C-terminal domain-containing protein n=1 Tax=Salmonella enterica TaxID=28901 RepID=UPI0020A40358
SPAAAPAKSAPAAPVKADRPAAAPKSKLSFKEQKELDGLPDRIAELEDEQATLTARLSSGALAAHEATGVSTRLGALSADI